MPTFNDDCQVADGPEGQVWMSEAITVTEPGPVKYVQSLKAGTKYVWHLTVSPVKGEIWSPPYSGAIVGEVWVAKPATVIKPDNMVQLGGAKTRVFDNAEKSSKIVSDVSWTLSEALGGVATEHVCFVGRIYEPGSDIKNLGFDLTTSKHIAQRNFSVVPTLNKQLEFDVYVAVPAASAPGPVNLRVHEDRKPSRALVQKLSASGMERAVFRRMAPEPALRFGVDVGTRLAPMVTDWTRPSLWSRLVHPLRAREYRARVTIPDTRSHKVTVRADLSRSRSGDAHLFHIVQTGMDGRTHGGVTVAAICP